MTEKRDHATTPVINRRDFLDKGARLVLALGSGDLLSCGDACLFSQTQNQYERPARHWRGLGKGVVQCLLCPNGCTLSPGDRGVCRARENRAGSLRTLVYSRIAALHVDPIEKKPFFHFMPGAEALSIATAGCNLSCRFCQNWQISQSRPEEVDAIPISPQNLVARAQSEHAPVIAFTYNEPTVQFEYVVDSAQRAANAGIKPVIISNGFIRSGPGKEFIQSLRGIKIDLKAFTQNFYSTICGGNLQSVLANLEMIAGAGRWLEIVVLVIPTLNDSVTEIRNMSRWIVQHCNRNVPVHFLRFHPTYLMTNLPPTPVSTLERCYTLARAAGLRYVYIGNVPGHRLENTYCHNCDREIISRTGIFMTAMHMHNGRCDYCNTQIPGVWA